MSNLTEKQQEVFDAISDETNTAKAIAEKLDTTVQSVNSTLTALEKKELITKNEDKTVYRLPLTDTPSTDTLPVLIPYLAAEAAGEELKYALRSLDKNLQTDIQVIVVGDEEDWFHDENITHIPVDDIFEDPQVDVANKLIAAIAALKLEGPIILTYDDVFVLGATDLSELLPFAYGKLNTTGTPGTRYHDTALRTAKRLEKAGFDTIRYDAHTPVVVDAAKIVDIISTHKALEEAVLIKSLYFNSHLSNYRPIQVTGGLHDPILASVYKADPKLAPLHDAVQKRKFMNCNTAGWKAVHPIMKSLFPEKSKFEK